MIHETQRDRNRKKLSRTLGQLRSDEFPNHYVSRPRRQPTRVTNCIGIHYWPVHSHLVYTKCVPPLLGLSFP